MIIMKKLLLLGLIGIVLFSGCIGSDEGVTGDVIAEPQITYSELGGSCRTNNDCKIAYCVQSLDRYCSSTVKAMTDIKCKNDNDKFMLENNIELCACVNNICILSQ